MSDRIDPLNYSRPEFDIPLHRGVDDLLEMAWTIIANASDWANDDQWAQAAIRWRDRYHSYLAWGRDA